MTLRQRYVAAAVTTCCMGCGSSPAAPSQPPPLVAGAYTFSVFAPDGTFVNDRLVPACPGAGPGGYGVMVNDATVDADGAVSRVRPRTAADGTFEIRLGHGSGGRQAGDPVSGSIRGVAINTRHAISSEGRLADARATFSGTGPAADLQVEGVSNIAVVTGTVSGSVVVGDSAGSVVTCASGTVRWSLSRIR